MKSSRRSAHGRSWAWSIGFLLSIAVVAGAAAYILWTGFHTDDRDERLIGEALHRAALITRLRLDAVALESAIEAHVRATSETQREEASELMSYLLEDLRDAREAYLASFTRKRPERVDAWSRFEETSLALAAQVREATGTPELRQAELSRRHLVERIQPLLVELQAQASTLTQMNRDEASALQRHFEQQRQTQLRWSGGVLGAAILFALLLGVAMSLLLRRQAQTIRAQLEALDAQNKELDAFAGRVAHDLVSPLAPLQGHLTVVKRSPVVKADPALTEHVERAQFSVGRMAGLVEALLRFCRAGERGEPSRCALDSVVVSQLLELSQTATASGVQLERDINRGTLVDCPSQLLHVIAQNVLSNAVKYTAGGEGALVRIRVASEANAGVLEVVDNGPGIANEVKAQLFRPFFRGPEAREKPGHGLGLATTRRLVEAHGGTLLLESSPGRGTRVLVRLPLPAEKPEPLFEEGRAP